MRKVGVDTNVLVYAHLPQDRTHEQVRAQLLALLRAEQTVVCVTPMILHELVHVITDARRFSPPAPIAQALAIARGYATASNVECLPVDAASTLLAFDLLDAHALGRKRIADTLFAATLLEHDVTELLTCNVDDFRIFDRLTLIDPRNA